MLLFFLAKSTLTRFSSAAYLGFLAFERWVALPSLPGDPGMVSHSGPTNKDDSTLRYHKTHWVPILQYETPSGGNIDTMQMHKKRQLELLRRPIYRYLTATLPLGYRYHRIRTNEIVFFFDNRVRVTGSGKGYKTSLMTRGTPMLFCRLENDYKLISSRSSVFF